MMITTKGRYAVMAMVDIAAFGKGKPVTIADVAERQDITVAYLEQIFARLRKGGLVKSVRGPGGGYLLSRPAAEIAVSEIVDAADETMKMTRCEKSTEGGCLGSKGRCLTHDLWEGLGNHINAYLGTVSLQDICNRDIPVEPIFEGYEQVKEAKAS